MEQPLRILMLEDEPRDADLAGRELRKAGLQFTAERVETEAAFVAAIEASAPDLILADYALPHFDGLSALTIAREKRPDTPVIIVSGTLGEERAIEALKAGATDYVLKQRLERLGSVVIRALREADDRRERRQAEEQLRKLSRAVEQSSASIIITDTRGNIEYVNPRFTEVTGYTLEEAVGKTPRILKSEETPPETYRQLWETITEGREWRGEFRNRKKNGALYWDSAVISPLKNAQGVITHYVANQEDITERRQTEEALRTTAGQLKNLFDNLDEVFFSLDAVNQKLLQISPACEKVYGLPQRAFLDNPLLWKEVVHPDDLGIAEAHQAEVFAGRPARGEYRIIRPDGEVRWVEGKVKPTLDNSGRVVRLDGVISDITRRKQAEARLRVQHETARALAESLILEDAAPEILKAVCEHLEWDIGELWLVDRKSDVLQCVDIWHSPALDLSEFEAFCYHLTFAPGKGLPGRVWTTGEPAWIPDVTQDLNFPRAQVAGQAGLHGGFAFPILSGGEVIGVIEFFSREIREPDQDILQMLATVGHQIGQFIERRRAEEGQRQQLQRVILLNQIARAIEERQDLHSIFLAVLGRLEDQLLVDYSGFFLYAPEKDELTVFARSPKSQKLAVEIGIPEKTTFSVEQSSLSPCLRGETVYVPDMGRESAPIPKRLAEAGMLSAVAAPLLAEGRVIGILAVARREADGFSSAEVEFLRTLAEHVALAARQAQLRQSLQEAYDDLHRTQQAIMQQERLKALGQMASGIAHDVNNALSPILGYAQMLLLDEEKLTSEQVHYLNIIQQSARDITHTIGQMREFYRQREAQELLLPVSLNEMAQQVLDLTRPRWRDMPQERGVVIEAQTDLQDRLPSVLGIESEVREALTNLIFNAVDALPQGGRIKIKTGIRGQGSGDGKNKSRDQDGGEREMAPTPDPRPPEGGQWVEVEVTDTGTGMDEETRRRCLEPFYSTKGEKGTGLGLAMVFGVMQRHEGEIEMESEVGRGTTVRLVFPIPQAGASRGLRPEQEDQPVPPLRVLCVEDDPAVRQVVKLMLKKDGHAVTVADGGQAGLDAFRAARERGEPFGVVLTDLGMPYVDGIEVARGVKRESPATPVILLSGWGKGALSRQEIPAEMDIVLGKPPELHALRRALRQVSAKKGQG